jgi:hypothetical protein
MPNKRAFVTFSGVLIVTNVALSCSMACVRWSAGSGEEQVQRCSNVSSSVWQQGHSGEVL